MINVMWYRVRVRHDKGIINIYTTAQDAETARLLVQASERCPTRAVLSVNLIPSGQEKARIKAHWKEHTLRFMADGRVLARWRKGRPYALLLTAQQLNDTLMYYRKEEK